MEVQIFLDKSLFFQLSANLSCHFVTSNMEKSFKSPIMDKFHILSHLIKIIFCHIPTTTKKGSIKYVCSSKIRSDFTMSCHKGEDTKVMPPNMFLLS